MSELRVPGARLYYELAGTGPLLLLIPGANGDGTIFRSLREHLTHACTVVTYDRRGFSSSALEGRQDYDRRLQTDADDARRLIEHLSDGPANVFGTSSGAVVALELLSAAPATVQTLVAFEPATMKQLPDGAEWLSFFGRLYAEFQNGQMEAALKLFREQTFAEPDWQIMARARSGSSNPHALSNARYWFEYELRQYTSVDLDIEALRAQAQKLVLAVGRDARGCPNYRVNEVLAQKLARKVIEFPGGHTGYVAHAAEFARSLCDVLAS